MTSQTEWPLRPSNLAVANNNTRCERDERRKDEENESEEDEEEEEVKSNRRRTWIDGSTEFDHGSLWRADGSC